MRAAAAVLAFALGACSQGQDSGGRGLGTLVACARGSEGEWAMACRLERSSADDHELLVVHRADGGFRRLEVLSDGQGVVPADGAAPVAQRWQGGLLEVSVGDDRYRLPLPVAANP